MKRGVEIYLHPGVCLEIYLPGLQGGGRERDRRKACSETAEKCIGRLAEMRFGAFFSSFGVFCCRIVRKKEKENCHVQKFFYGISRKDLDR